MCVCVLQNILVSVHVIPVYNTLSYKHMLMHARMYTHNIKHPQT